MAAFFSPSTRQVLGHFAATSYIGLGTFTMIYPVLAAKCFGVYPETDTDTISTLPSTAQPDGKGSSEKNLNLNPTSATSTADKQNHASAAATSMLLLGARDLSLGIALAWLDYQSDHRAMGTVILSGLVLCVVDVYEIWRLRGPARAAPFAAATGGLMGIGYELIQ